MKLNDIVTVSKNYGVVRLKLREIMEQNDISRNTLARKIDVRFEVVDRWYNGNIEKMDLDILARICFVLGCGVDDIIEYSK